LVSVDGIGIWRDVLGKDSVGIFGVEGDFLGGRSLGEFYEGGGGDLLGRLLPGESQLVQWEELALFFLSRRRTKNFFLKGFEGFEAGRLGSL
jgi:hypothetical protein